MSAAAKKLRPMSDKEAARFEERVQRLRAEDAAARASSLVREQTTMAMSEIVRARGQLDEVFAQLEALDQHDGLGHAGRMAYVEGCQALHHACAALRHLAGIDERRAEQ